MNDLRLGVIGAGGRGNISTLAHNPGEGTRLVAACGLDRAPLEKLKVEYGDDFLISQDYRDILAVKEINAVFICSPDFLHEKHALAAIQAGKSIFLEKPMAISIKSCDRILDAAAKAKVKLYVGHNMRFFPVMRQMKELIDRGAIGQVQAVWCRHFISYGGDAYFKDWHSERKYAFSLLLQKGAHDIDIIHWLAGGHSTRSVGMGKLSVYDKLPRRKPEEIVGRPVWNRKNYPPRVTGGYSPVVDVEDHSMALLQLDNGVQASYLQCHYTPDDTRNYTVIGTEGRLENYGDHSTEENWASVHLWNRRTGYTRDGHEIIRIPPIEGSHGGADPLMIRDFIHYLKTGEHSGATPWDARMAVAAGYGAAESLRNGNQPFDIPAVSQGD